MNGQYVDLGRLDPSYIYNRLNTFEDTFHLLGQGVFSLTAWERIRADTKDPIVSYCPSPLTSSEGDAHSFFESVLVGQDLLANGLSAEVFIEQILDWADTDGESPDWLCQGYLTAYYLVGLVPFIFYPGDRNQVLRCILSEGSVHDVRRHCLENLNRRLEAMPTFWWLLQRHQPSRVTRLGELLADAHPAGLDDASNRLTILVSLGTVVEEYGQYRLTPFGEELAEAWAQRPDVVTEHSTPPASDPAMDDWLELGTWL